jgi:hypothetical protein
LNANVNATLTGRGVMDADANLSAVRTRGDETVRIDAAASLRNGSPFDARLSTTTTSPRGNWAAGVNWSRDAGTAVSGSWSQTEVTLPTLPGKWSVSAGTQYRFRDDNFSANLSANRPLSVFQKNDGEVGITGSVDNKGNASVGAAVLLRF